MFFFCLAELHGFVLLEKNLRRHCAVEVDHVLVICPTPLGGILFFFEFELLSFERNHLNRPEET